MSESEHIELPLNAAAKRRDLRPQNVDDRRREGAIHTHPATRGRAKRLVWLDEFDEDIAALRCQCGCGRSVTNASKWADQGCSRRKYPVGKRICPVCGEEFDLLGCYAQRDRQAEPCCCDSHEAIYRWRGGPEAFGRPPKGGSYTDCANCGISFYRFPSRPNQRFCPDCDREARAVYHATDAAKRYHELGKQRLIRWQLEEFPARVEARKAERGGAIDTGRMGAVLDTSASAVVTYWIKKLEAPAEEVRVSERRYVYLADPRKFAEWWRDLTGSTAVAGKLSTELAAGPVGRAASPHYRPPSLEQEKQIRWLASIRRPERDIAERVGCSRHDVRKVLGR